MQSAPKNALVLVLLVAACNQSKFSGEAPSARGSAPQPAVVTPGPAPTPGASEPAPSPATPEPGPAPAPSDEPTDLTVDNGVAIAPPNYVSCAALPDKGKRGYGSCADGQVVVIVNDGKAEEMSCCPVGGKKVLSEVANEKHQERNGQCQAGEVATGMKSATGPVVLCTKVNAALKLSAPVKATYVSLLTQGLSPALREIANSYNLADTCACPDTHVMIGGHVLTDNACADQCVRIEKR